MVSNYENMRLAYMNDNELTEEDKDKREGLRIESEILQEEEREGTKLTEEERQERILAAKRKYAQSENGKQNRSEWRKSDKGKLYKMRERERKKGLSDTGKLHKMQIVERKKRLLDVANSIKNGVIVGFDRCCGENSCEDCWGTGYKKVS